MVMIDMIKIKSSILKSSASLANVTAKQYFLKVCSDNGIFPKGFTLKFSLLISVKKDAK